MDKLLKVKFLLIRVSFLLLCLSCSNTSKVNESEKVSQTHQKENDQSDNNDYSFIENYQYKTLPILDSTNFDNFNFKDSLTKQQIKLLGLKKLDPNENTIFWINYRLDLSKDYTSLVITYYPDENDLFTTLVNYNTNFEIIDFIEVAFDEIAESCLRMESLIKKAEIEITEYNYCPEMFTYPEKKIVISKIGINGAFNASH